MVRSGLWKLSEVVSRLEHVFDSDSTDSLAEALARLEQSSDAVRREEVAQLVLAAHVADLVPLPAHEPDTVEALFGERSVRPGGVGTPLVAEWAPEHLATATGGSVDQARELLADALVLRHRLPHLWRLVTGGDRLVRAWQARVVADYARRLPGLTATEQTDRDLLDAVHATLDQRLTRLLDRAPRSGRPTLLGACRDAHHAVHPDTIEVLQETALAERGVWFHSRCFEAPAAEMFAVLDVDAAHELDDVLGTLAERLRDYGDASGHDVRRATALGALAHPQAALDLLVGPSDDRADEPHEAPHAPGVRRRHTLYLHLRTSDLVTGEGGAVAEGVGPATLDLVRCWLTDSNVTVRPVLRLPGRDDLEPAVDGHEPTTAMRETVHLTHGTCAFPGCAQDSRRCQLDHIEPYVDPDQGGPPGQTRVANLAPLCARHHRMKTHGRWRYRRQPDGRYRWTTPTGRVVAATPLARWS